MKRREFFILLGAVAGAGWSRTARAQPPMKVGVVWHAGSADEEEPYFGAFHRGCVDLGYIDNALIEFHHRFANEQPDRFVNLTADLAVLPVDLIVTVTLPAALAAQRATKTIPIIFILVPDPVRSQLVASFSRPGGNITGLTQIAVELSAKRLELLKEAVPHMQRVALLVNANDQQTMRRVIDENNTAASALDLSVQSFEVHSLDDFERACDKMVESRSEGIVVYPDGLTYQGRRLLAQYARERSLPLMMFSRESLAAGALLSYGPDYKEIFYRAASYVDKIRKGGKPSNMPVEAPRKFEFCVNMKTAEALKIEIPTALLYRADEVIE